MIKSQFVLIPLVAIIFGGCTHFETAKPQVANIDIGQSQQNAIKAKYSPIELSKWWIAFNDPILNTLINDAISQNFDIAIATHRINEARAQNLYSKQSLKPNSSIGAKVQGNELSENGALPITKIPGISREQLVFQYGYDASWEIDVFGGLKHQIDASDAAIQSLYYSQEGAKISIAAEIARNYFELNNTNRQILAINDYLHSLDETITLLKLRVKRGDISQKDIEEIIAKRENYATQLPTLEGKRRDLAYAIAALIGKPPEATAYLLQQSVKPLQLYSFPLGARSELLQRRPDIRAAEAMLQMRASEIKANEAEHYPKFVINAHAGWETTDIKKAFDTSSIAASIIPGIQWRIFDNGRIDAQVNAAKEREQQALAEYSKSVINALSDSERALNAYKSALDTIDARKSATKAQSDFYNHQLKRFKAGDISKLELLDAERSIKDLNIQNIQTESLAQTQLISLFKALGGGWNNDK